MNYVSIVTLAAKKVGVSATLLMAICTHESGGLKNVLVPDDKGTPSYGVCQVKLATARMVGYKGDGKGLMNPSVNAKFAAKYLKYQVGRYGEDDWCKLVSAYNAGTYNESKKIPGKPRNLKYVKHVQKKLDESLQHRLSCNNELAEAHNENSY